MDGSELYWNMHAVGTQACGDIRETDVLAWSDCPRPKLHCLRLLIPNVYLLTGKRSVLIDAGAPSDVPRILEFLCTVGQDLSLILLTHGHWDHAGGAKALRDATKAPIALHRKDLELVRQGNNGSTKPTCTMGFIIRAFVDRSFPPFEPDIVIEDEMDLGPFGVDARVLLTPGHTPGSISVLTAEGDAIVGDLLMGGWLGGKIFSKRPGLHYFADDVEQLKASLRYVLSLKPRWLHPGHGLPLDPAQSALLASV
jgi:glyoxylase-like metal-dependent hydrolase (beta-lactamase superfamily II)